jgi:hypothetical protein
MDIPSEGLAVHSHFTLFLRAAKAAFYLTAEVFERLLWLK